MRSSGMPIIPIIPITLVNKSDRVQLFGRLSCDRSMLMVIGI